MKKMYRKIIVVLLVIVAVMNGGCKKFLDVGAPKTTLATNNVYTDNSTAANVLTALYIGLSSDGYIGGIELTEASNRYLGVASDELSLYSTNDGNMTAYWENAISQNGTTSNYVPFWSSDYNAIYQVNAAIVGLQASTSLTDSVKTRLLGEAYFLRSFFYFYLTNIFGDVPLILTTDYIKNGKYARTPQDSVYHQIVDDLLQAQQLLSDHYLNADVQTTSSERLRPNRAVATAMLARVYLYTGQYDKAIDAASTLINNTAVYQLESLNNVFLRQSREAIWQLQPVNGGYNTPDGQTYVIPSTGPSDSYPYLISSFLLDSFYTGDLRKQNWLDTVTSGGVLYYFPYKYKVGGNYDATVTGSGNMTEYIMVMRLAEMYLIRAEAKLLYNNDANGCVADINVIRERAGVADYAGPMDPTSLEKELLRERQVELFTEWGHRWFDMKRTGKIDEIMNVVSPAKNGVWSSYKQLLPLPMSDINVDQHLAQNPGY